jgi:hypothetical protein
MSAQYTLPARVRLYGDLAAAAMLIPRARGFLGMLAERVQRAHLKTGHWEFEDQGAYFIFDYNPLLPTISINVQQTPVVLAIIETSTLWLPRGFVCYPSSASSVSGWGTPVVGSGSIFTVANTAPGLNVARWTLNGGLGEVLLTQAVDAGYPLPTVDTLPLFFGATEFPTVSKGQYIAPVQGPWTGYRIEFDGFTQATGQGGLGRQALFTSLNVGREYCLPVRGYYDPAARDVQYATAADYHGTLEATDADLTSAPAGYIKAVDRKNKDGIVDPASIDTLTRATDNVTIVLDLEVEAQLGGSHFTQPKTALSLGGANGSAALTAVERAQWIACGNRTWLSPGLPAVSWDGFCSMNFSVLEQYGTVDLSHPGNFTQDYDQFMYTARGVARPTFSKNVYANGRIIGQTPDFVLSVGVQTIGASRRVVALACLLSDQNGPLPDHGPGFMVPMMSRRYRVYFLDVPDRNGVVLAPSSQAIGLYNASTNPSGWHYAGYFDVRDLDFETRFSVLQPPVFNAAGTKAVCVINDFTIDNTSYAVEITFTAISDDTLVVTVNNGLELNQPFSSETVAIDYAADGSFVYLYIAIVNLPGFLTGEVLRWNKDANVASVDLQPSDLQLGGSVPTDLYGEGVALYLTDAINGRGVLLRQSNDIDGNSIAIWTVTKSGADITTSDTFADPSNTITLAEFVEAWGNGMDSALIYRARDHAGNTIDGVEINATWPGHPIPGFLGSSIATSFGDLAALTQTPGTDSRYYPVGVV